MNTQRIRPASLAGTPDPTLGCTDRLTRQRFVRYGTSLLRRPAPVTAAPRHGVTGAAIRCQSTSVHSPHPLELKAISPAEMSTMA